MYIVETYYLPSPQCLSVVLFIIAIYCHKKCCIGTCLADGHNTISCMTILLPKLVFCELAFRKRRRYFRSMAKDSRDNLARNWWPLTNDCGMFILNEKRLAYVNSPKINVSVKGQLSRSNCHSKLNKK